MSSFALTLVSKDYTLSAGVLAELEAYLDKEKLAIEREPRWLSEHKAADLIIADCISMDHMNHIRTLSADMDVFCISTINRRKQLLCADMESTIIENEMLEELADVLGIKEKIAAITARAMNGELDFTQSLIERTALLKGLPKDTLNEFLPRLKINQGAKTLVQTMNNNGATCVLVTGGFTFFSAPIAEEVGFRHHHANAFDIQDGKLTGELLGAILDSDAKLTFLQYYAQQMNIKTSDAMTIGDGANDLPMLTEAGFGVGYYPKPVLQDTLINQIRHTDFTAALFAQGYTEQDFIS